MTLQQKLQELKALAAENIPPETRAKMLAATEQLSKSNILKHAIRVGDRVADFTLSDASGKDVSLRELRHQGPVVISLYRGIW